MLLQPVLRLHKIQPAGRPQKRQQIWKTYQEREKRKEKKGERWRQGFLLLAWLFSLIFSFFLALLMTTTVLLLGSRMTGGARDVCGNTSCKDSIIKCKNWSGWFSLSLLRLALVPFCLFCCFLTLAVSSWYGMCGSWVSRGDFVHIDFPTADNICISVGSGWYQLLFFSF